MADAGNIIVRLIADASQYMQAMGAAGKATGAVGTNMAVVSRKMEAAGEKMTRNVTLPVLALGAVGAKLALNFEDAFTDIEALVGASADEIMHMREAVLSLAPAVGKGPQELAEALYFITSSGLEGSAALDALKASATAAAAGLGDTMTIADAVTSAINAYGQANLSASQTTDILTAAVREGKSEPEEFAGSIGRVIPLASKMGVEFGEVAGIMAAMSLNGTNANEAVTQISAMLSTAIKPTKEGAEALKSVGESYASIRKRIREDGLLEAVEHLNKAFDGDIEKTAEVFGNIRALRGILALTGPEAKKYAGIIDRVAQAHGDTAKAAEIALEKPGAKLKKAWAGIQSSLIGLGDVALPTFASIAESVSGAAAAFGKLDESTKRNIVVYGLLLAAVGPVLPVLGKLGSVSVAAASGIATMGKTVAALGAASRVGGLAGFGATLAAALGPIGLVTAALAGAGGLTYALTKLDQASTGAADANDKLDAALAALEADTSGKLQAWADKTLGGHFVSKEGQIVWQPAVEVKTGEQAGKAVDKWVRAAAAQERAAIREEQTKTMLAVAEARKAVLEQQIRVAEDGMSGMSGPGGGQAKESPLLKKYREQLEGINAEVSKLRGKQTTEINLGIGQVSIAKLTDLKAKAADLRGEIEKLGKIPAKNRTIEIIAKENKLRAQLKQINAEITKETSKNREVRIGARIEAAQAKLKSVNSDLDALHKRKPTPQVDADIKKLEAKKRQVEDRMKRLNALEANPTVTLKDNATSQAEAVRRALAVKFGMPIVQSVYIRTTHEEIKARRAAGGPVSGGYTYLVGERGPELFHAPASGHIIPNHQLSGGSSGPSQQQTVRNFYISIDGYNQSVDEILADVEDYETRMSRAV